MKDLIKKTSTLPLRNINYRETSKIVTAFTEQFGKVQLIAKGVRNPKSRMAAALQNLIHAEIVFYKKENQELYLLKDATVVDFFEHIHGDLARFAYASVISDFLYTMLASEQISKTLFQYSIYTLKHVDSVTKPELPAVLVRYLLKGSSIIGFTMLLDKCASCGREHPDPVFFSHDTGGIICESCLHIDQQASRLDPLLHQFLRQSQDHDHNPLIPRMKQSDYQKLFLLLSNWFYFHNNRVLKTLSNLIQGKPFKVYEHHAHNGIPTFHKEE
jgi:DNA repair protein RecO (recombination protein O)